MKKRFPSLPAFALGAIVGAALTAGTAAGAAVYLKATPSPAKITVNGSETKLSDSPVVIQNKLYVPVRQFSEALGYQVDTVENNRVGIIGKAPSDGSNSTPPAAPSKPSGSAPEESHLVKNLGKLIEHNGEISIQKINLVIAAGEARLNSQDETTGNGFLHYLILNGDSALYDSFIQLNGQVAVMNFNLRNFEGHPPLHLAVIHKNESLIEKLLTQQGVDASIQDASGKTALDYAEEGSKTYELLLSFLDKTRK